MNKTGGRPPGVSHLERSDVPHMVEMAHAQGAKVLWLPSAGVRGQQDLFENVRRHLPLDPPLHLVNLVWDALEDSVWGGMDAMGEPVVVLFWTDSDLLKREDGDTFKMMLCVLRDLTDSLSRPENTDNSPVDLRVYIVDP